MQAGKGNAAKWVWLALGMLFSPVQPGGAQAPVAETFTLDEAADALAIGRAAYEDGLFDLSRRRLEELVEKAPDRRRRAEGAIWLARVSLAQGKPDAALAMLQQVSEVRAISLLAELALTRAQAYAAKGDWKTVALELAPFQERFVGQSNAPVALHLLVHMLAAEQKWEEARQAILLLEDRYPEHPETVA
ncbi:MAG: hypothetical protein LBN38_04870, partial [Verrucomicrobiota bacterium]|nr:hypothetical protein [Verrucomicrobiota bacterium]